MARSLPMEGRATPTMDMSRASRKSAPHKVTRSSQVRLFQPVDAETVKPSGSLVWGTGEVVLGKEGKGV
ncbi:hypothetical protein QF027_007667 [Streptomyces canus]|nr:hypothetical protein [Streptomyces canus]